MSNTKTVPTEPGAYYLDNGQPAVVWPSCGSLLCRGESVEWVDSAATTWATGPDGGPVRVPTLSEWEALVSSNEVGANSVSEVLAVSARLSHAGIPPSADVPVWERVRQLHLQRDEARRERDAASDRCDEACRQRDCLHESDAKAWAILDDVRRALGLEGSAEDADTDGTEVDAVVRIVAERDWWHARADELTAERNAAQQDANQARRGRDALRTALAVPEGVDAVAMVPALYSVVGAAKALLWAAERESGQAIAMAAIRDAVEAVDALRSPPRPLPDGPGWWWGMAPGATDATPVLVEYVPPQRVAGPGGMSLDGWTWLAGHDGRAVRCTPPEVTRG